MTDHSDTTYLPREATPAEVAGTAAALDALARKEEHAEQLYDVVRELLQAYEWERECLRQSVSDREGNVDDPDDAAALAEFDGLLNKTRALLRDIDGEEG